MKKLFTLFAIAALLCTGCSKEYNDGEIWNIVHGLENRVAALEELCRQMNTNISSLLTIVTALQNNDCVTGVAPVMKNGETIGYTLIFSKSAPITIYCNENDTGASGHTPVIGVRQDTDGVYYWTLDGDWLTDENGNKIKAEGRDGADGESGKDGADGVTPQLKIEGGDWYVSTDNGTTWTNFGKATGVDGANSNSMFQSVAQDENNVYFTLADGETIVLPKKQQLAITFAEGNEFFFDINETKTVNYTITGGGTSNVVKAEMQNLDGNYTLYTTSTSATKGTIKITAKVPTANHIIVSVSDGNHTIMVTIDVALKASFDDKTVVVAIPGTLSQLLDDYDQSAVTELTVIGNLNSSDILTLKKLPNLAVLDMEQVNLDELPKEAFQYKNSLRTVKLPQTSKTIGYRAFCMCEGLTSITIGNSVTEIGHDAFDACNSLTSVTIPDSVTTIGTQAFMSCTGLTSITIGNSVTEIGTSAFNSCINLTSVTIPDSVTTIGAQAFFNCNRLTSITIPNSVTEIGTSAFGACNSLTSITIGNSVKTIGNLAFSCCNSLTSIYCKAQTPPSVGADAFYQVNLTSVTLYVPTGCKEAYAVANGWKKFSNIFEMD